MSATGDALGQKTSSITNVSRVTDVEVDGEVVVEVLVEMPPVLLLVLNPLVEVVVPEGVVLVAPPPVAVK
jgi:hypothetical protein